MPAVRTLWTRAWHLILLLGGVLVLLRWGPGTAAQGTPLYPSPNERLGFGVTKGLDNTPRAVLGALNAGWYVNWGAAPDAPHPQGLTYVQIIRLTQTGYTPSGEALVDIIRRNPGTLWLIGNEPDSPFQDNQTPEQYVEKYHELYSLIKRVDPSAQVAIGGVIQATPLRLQYLDMIWDLYQERYGRPMPVDVWNVHNFILREARTYCSPGGIWGAYIPPGIPADCGAQYTINDHDNMTIFREQIVRFRQWMKAKGQQNKPLIVSEYGILFPEELGFTQERVQRFMLNTFDFFLNARDPDLGYPADEGRLVQQWAWFSLDETSFEWGRTHSALYDPAQGRLTPLGEAFAAYAGALRVPYVDLRPAGVQGQGITPFTVGEAGTLALEVRVANDGNTPANGTVRVERIGPDGVPVPVGTAAVQHVPMRYAGTATVVFTDTVRLDAPLRYRVTTQHPQEARPANDRQTFTLPLDLQVTSVAARMTAGADRTFTVTLTAAVFNGSPFTLRGVPVAFSVREGSGWRAIGRSLVTDIAPNTVGLARIRWQAPAQVTTLKADVDPDAQVAETNEHNNAVSRTVVIAPYSGLLPWVSVSDHAP